VTSAARRRDDSGAASVWAVSLVALLGVALIAVALVVDVLAARSRASAAADLAALAAAPAAASSSPAACPVAASVAEANGARLMSCAVVSGEVRVVAEVRWSGPFRRAMALLADVPGAQAGARAGLR